MERREAPIGRCAWVADRDRIGAVSSPQALLRCKAALGRPEHVRMWARATPVSRACILDDDRRNGAAVGVSALATRRAAVHELGWRK